MCVAIVNNHLLVVLPCCLPVCNSFSLHSHLFLLLSISGTSTPNNKNTKKKQSKTAAATTTEDKDEDLLFSQYLSNSRHNHLKLGYNKTHPLGRTSDQFSRIVQLHNLHNPDSRSSNPENLESGLSTNLESADSGSESGSSRLSSWGLSTDAATMSASEYYDNPGPHNGPVDPWEYEEMEKELVAAGKIDTEGKQTRLVCCSACLCLFVVFKHTVACHHTYVLLKCARHTLPQKERYD